MRANDWTISRRRLVAMLGASAGAASFPAWAEMTERIAPQPYFASVKRAIASLANAGQPISKGDSDRLVALAVKGDTESVAAAEAILGRYTLARVALNKEGMGQAALGGADRTLIEQGWRSFLVRVSNASAIGGKFDVSTGWSTPGRMSQPNGEQRAGLMDTLNKAPMLERLWLTSQVAEGQALSGSTLEYQLIELFSRDHGKREGKLAFGAGTQEFFGRSYSRAALADPLIIEFDARESHNIALSIIDTDGVACMASLLIKDAQDHVYPPQSMRIAPDMFFHPHIYRADGETVRLPDGEYLVRGWRGPEYLPQFQTVDISESNRVIAVDLKRWIDPSRWDWYSGDTHLHASGCAHYVHPTEGVTPETMIRHVRGEALSIAEVLTWAGGYYYQEQFFSGHAISPEASLEYPELQTANNATWKPRPTPKDLESHLRYDLEVSGFPSSLCGHLVLLRLKEQKFPGTQTIEDWPSWTLPILKWAKDQGAVVGFTHCGLGMGVATTAIPNYEIPRFDSIGMNEVIMDVTHDACDFISGGEFEPAWELNAWYHILNCGFPLRMVGETDYPCITGERPGVGRTYVRLEHRPKDDAGYSRWIDGMKAGRFYYGDGRSHFLEITVNSRTLGETVELARPGVITLRALVAARIEPSPTDETRAIKSGWHLERARIGDSRNVPLELIVNGQSVERVELRANGQPRAVRFKTHIERSSWIALRILPSGHTHPIFVTIDGKSIRASRRSAEWLRKCVDVLWNEKHRLMRESERPAAVAAYDHARRTYERILAESEVA